MIFMRPVILNCVAFAGEKTKTFSTTLDNGKSIFQGDTASTSTLKKRKDFSTIVQASCFEEM